MEPGFEKRAPEAGVELAALLDLLRELTRELQGERGPAQVHPNSRLDVDLGLDSLSRVELAQRVVARFGVEIPEQQLFQIETVAELLSVLQRDGGDRQRLESALALEGGGVDAPLPVAAQTLVEVLAWHAERHPERIHCLLQEGDGETPIHYGALYQQAQSVASGLASRGVQRGDTVAIMLPTGVAYLRSFFAILMLGAIPVPIYPPVRLSQLDEHLRRHGRILDNAGCVLLITVTEALKVGTLLRAQVPTLGAVVTANELAQGVEPLPPQPVTGSDIAFIQYTSGSTGNPKGVTLTHAQLLANIRIMGASVGIGPEDRFISWLPLYHDMGLIGAWLGSLYFAMPLVLMSPLSFLARPMRWLQAIHTHRGTLSAAPNFAYELCASKIPETELQGLDLSSWRIAFNGAEAVNPDTLSRFQTRFAAYGLHPHALSPVYGLAEAAVGLAFPDFDRVVQVDAIQRQAFSESGAAIPTTEPDESLRFVACGHAMPEYEVRVVDGNHQELPDRREGRLQFKGPSATDGYYRNPAATTELYCGDWLETGDRAYLVGGEIFITGRSKDIIIRAGRNLYPHEIEEWVSGVEGVRRGCVAVFGASDPQGGTERLIVMAETRINDPGQQEGLRQQIQGRVTESLGEPVDEVLLVPPHSVLKTSSGKIRRSACRQWYEAGGHQTVRPLWWRLARLALSSSGPLLMQGLRNLRQRAYSLYAKSCFYLLAIPVWSVVPLLPGLRLRWWTIARALRLLARITGNSLRVRGREHLPTTGPYVLVANHASYLDGAVLIALLPQPLRFIAKGELTEHRLARYLLDAIATYYVERFNAQQGAADAEALKQAALRGEHLAFFPEGTFKRMSGLLPFSLGAFTAAASAGVPVVPVTIRGTRAILRGDEGFVRRGGIELVIDPPIQPKGADWQAAVRLRDAARERILARSEEPDLS